MKASSLLEMVVFRGPEAICREDWNWKNSHKYFRVRFFYIIFEFINHESVDFIRDGNFL